MPHQNPSHEEIVKILGNVKTIAMVGASDKTDRPSHRVMRFLQAHEYKVIPVNPALDGQSLLGEIVYKDLKNIPSPIDMVDIFRAGETAGPIVDEAIAIGARVVWMQLGVINEEAAARAAQAGLTVIMDRCPAIELR